MKKRLFLFSCLALGLSMFSCGDKPNKIELFHLSDVKLLDSDFSRARAKDVEYIMAHNPDRLLSPYLREAGLEPKAESYGNWENTGLDGHICGHYLTALAQMSVTGNPELAERLDYMIDELYKCQTKNGNGYIGGVPGGMAMWKDIAAGKISAQAFGLNGKWVPWYNIHKMFAGLYDVYTLTGNEKAKEMLVGMCDWCDTLVANLSDEQLQDMLRSEHGGMNEVLAQTAELTGNMKYLDLARRFSHRQILDPLLKFEDKHNGMHANTQIPKVIGYEKIAAVSGDTAWHNATVFFWDRVVNHRSVSIGGNSVREHFHPDNDFSSMVESREGPETCNTYNMMKLSKLLFLADNTLNYIDYYERAMFNHILSSQNPEHGGLVYFTPMRPQHYRVYSKPESAFWCCVGSGMENHGKYGELIYAHDDNNLYVNLFVPSQLAWKEKGITVTQQTKFPDDCVTELVVNVEKPLKIGVNVRWPEWVADGKLEVEVNGELVDVKGEPQKYVAINRKWNDGDIIKVTLPMDVKVVRLPDSSDFVSFEYGPIVLASVTGTNDLDGLVADDSRMGHIASGKLYPIDETPIFVTDVPEQELRPIRKNSELLSFELPSQIKPSVGDTLELKPFSRIHDARYVVYWPVVSPKKMAAEQEKIKAREREKMALEARTIDMVSPGEQQPESDHFFKGEGSESGVHKDRHWRHASKWFSYELKDKNRKSKVLRITYFGLDRNRNFDIVVNNETVASVSLDGSHGDDFFFADYDLPSNVVEKSSGKLLLKFVAKEGSLAGGIYEVRLLGE